MYLASLPHVPLELQSALVACEVLGHPEFLALVSDLSPAGEGALLVATPVTGLESDKSPLILLFEVKSRAHAEGTVARGGRVGDFPLEEVPGAWS